MIVARIKHCLIGSVFLFHNKKKQKKKREKIATNLIVILFSKEKKENETFNKTIIKTI